MSPLKYSIIDNDFKKKWNKMIIGIEKIIIYVKESEKLQILYNNNH